jgi:hypothetical protein
MELLEPNTTIDSDTPPNQDHFKTPPLPTPPKECVVCGEPATQQKFLNGEIIGVCRQDFLFTSTGKIAQAIRERVG